jgi:hypothetical protein
MFDAWSIGDLLTGWRTLSQPKSLVCESNA